MKKIATVLFPILLIMAQLSAQYAEKDINNYINQYKELAIWKMYEYKIPASITLAQGVFESACGTSKLAREGNNHFGIKCHNDWTGDTLKIDDDALQECFRRYETAEESYTDHSLFLTSRSRYASLFSLDIMDYKAWAHGLKAAGYATNPQYADRLINLIERYNIAQWDTVFQQRLASNWFNDTTVQRHAAEEQIAQSISLHRSKNNDKPAVSAPQRNSTSSNTTIPAENQTETDNGPVFILHVEDLTPVKYPLFTERDVYIYNNVYFVLAVENDTYAQIATDVQETEKYLRRYNDIDKNKKTPVAGEVIYLSTKSKSSPAKQHIVAAGETLRYISQRYAVQLNSIYKYNNLTEKSVINPGDIIILKH